MVSTLQYHSVQMTAERSVIGIYCVIFGLYCQIQIKRADRRRNGVLLYALIANFILCTAYFIDSTVQVKFKIVVSHILHVIVLYYCSDIMHVRVWIMAPNVNGVQLIFDSELPGIRADRRFICSRCVLDGQRSRCTIYRHRLHFTINIGECTWHTNFLD